MSIVAHGLGVKKDFKIGVEIESYRTELETRSLELTHKKLNSDTFDWFGVSPANLSNAS